MYEWQTEWEVGEAAVDEQHQKLFDILNEIEQGVKSGRDDQIIQNLLGTLGQTLRRHCAAEEQWMESIGFADRLKHQMNHNCFLEEFREQLGKIPAGATVKIINLLEFVGGWLGNHFASMDRLVAGQCDAG